jgi:hypothetical protein
MPRPFIERIRPAPKTPAFHQEDYWVWCGSVVRGEDGRYHLFASRWPKSVPLRFWVFYCEIVRAVSDTPEGPYRVEEVVAKGRGAGFWDGSAAHNPSIYFHEGKYLLFYTGVCCMGGEPPRKREEDPNWARYAEAWNHKRVGLMVADSVYGPWTRPDRPLLEPRPGKWDGVIISNPGAAFAPDGSITLIYKSCDRPHPPGDYPGRFNLGVARAANWHSPFQRLSDGPITLSGSSDNHVEDPFIWWNGEGYEMIAKDMTGEVCGEPLAGIHAFSRDAINWEVQKPAKAYSRTVAFNDGTTTELPILEKPQILFHDGKPTHLFVPTMKKDLPPNFTLEDIYRSEILDTCLMVLPLG